MTTALALLIFGLVLAGCVLGALASIGALIVIESAKPRWRIAGLAMVVVFTPPALTLLAAAPYADVFVKNPRRTTVLLLSCRDLDRSTTI